MKDRLIELWWNLMLWLRLYRVCEGCGECEPTFDYRED